MITVSSDEENWAVGYIKEILARYHNCKVEVGLLSSERIYIPQLKALCVENYWYIDPLSDGYISFRLFNDWLRRDSCTRKICGLTAQEAVEDKIHRRSEAIYKRNLAYTNMQDLPPTVGDMPEIHTYRIQWLSRPLHRIYDEKQEYIPIWHLI